MTFISKRIQTQLQLSEKSPLCNHAYNYVRFPKTKSGLASGTYFI